ncbi:MAG: nucleoside kinase [Acholeplasmatales bacterium]|nr:MAG: nucleoside kinase [Acholeplasmatales bacterium]
MLPMFTLNVKGEKKPFHQPVRLHSLIDDPEHRYFIALVNNRLRELHYLIDYDADVEFLDNTNQEAVFVYEASLRFLVSKAFFTCFPELSFKFNYSISRSIFCHIDGVEDTGRLRDITATLMKEMKRLVEADVTIERRELDKKKAAAFYEEHLYHDKLDILQYRPEDVVHFYACGDYMNYMYSLMAPSTGYLKDFDLKIYSPGFLIRYPRSEEHGRIPLFEDAPIYGRTLRNANRWSERIDANTLAKVNRHAAGASMVEFVHVNEAKHNQMIAEIGHLVLSDIENVRLIAIAGPSSSGKTTFSTRLRIELLTLGLKPIMISLDDYYLNREDILPNEEGVIDLEHINTLDIALFNQNMLDLIDGKAVDIPHFNFMTKARDGHRTIRITDNSPIIIEGIHALNDSLTELIPKHQKFKIFISPQLQMNMDHHNPLSITDVRMLRRIVRDRKFRNSPATKTIGMWPSVRRGEFKWIYPHQEDADYIFNSALAYELCVMKKYALDTLMEIPRDHEHFITANRLIKFLKHIVDIEDHIVPCNSLLREFIGGSCFEV